MKRGRVTNCRECDTPILPSLDGVVIGKNRNKGWCDPCIRKSAYLMAYLAKLTMEDIEFDDVKSLLARETELGPLDEFGGFVGDICPKCKDDIVNGSHVGACRKCNPEYFEECEQCGQERISCICYTESLI